MLERSKALLAKVRQSRTRHAVEFVAVAGVFIYKAVGRAQLVQQLGVLAWKLLLVGVAVLAAHRIRRALFPYIDLSAHCASGDANGGRIFLGVMLFYSAVILAVLAGL